MTEKKHPVHDILSEVSDEITMRLGNARVQRLHAKDRKLQQRHRALWTRLAHDIAVRNKTASPQYEGLRETLLEAYTADERSNLPQRIATFVERHRVKLHDAVMRHTPGAEDYVASRDYLYAVPEVVLIAERAINKPAMLRHVFKYSDFEQPIDSMITDFQEHLV